MNKLTKENMKAEVTSKWVHSHLLPVHQDPNIEFSQRKSVIFTVRTFRHFSRLLASYKKKKNEKNETTKKKRNEKMKK